MSESRECKQVVNVFTGTDERGRTQGKLSCTNTSGRHPDTLNSGSASTQANTTSVAETVKRESQDYLCFVSAVLVLVD